HAAQAEGHADSANQQQRLAAKLVDERHAHQRRQQVHRAHRDRLQIAGDLVESRHGENVIQVIQDGVDSGELVEGRDGEGEIDREPVFALEERLGVRRVSNMHGGNNLVEFALGIVGPQLLQHLARLGNAILGNQPTRTSWNAEQHDQEQDGGSGGDTELPAPFVHAKAGQPDQVIAEISNQDSDHDVDLERAHQQPSPARGSDLGDIHRPQPRRAANAQSADEAEDQQRWPAPRKGAAESRNDVAACQNASALAPAELVAHDSREHGPDDRPQERDRYGKAQLFRGQTETQAELLGGAGEDSGVEAEEQTAQRADYDAANQ